MKIVAQLPVDTTEPDGSGYMCETTVVRLEPTPAEIGRAVEVLLSAPGVEYLLVRSADGFHKYVADRVLEPPGEDRAEA